VETRSSSFANQSKEGDAGQTESPLFFVREKRKALAQRTLRKNTLRRIRSGQAEVTEKSDPGAQPEVLHGSFAQLDLSMVTA
jgi:hypothetical protein